MSNPTVNEYNSIISKAEKRLEQLHTNSAVQWTPVHNNDNSKLKLSYSTTATANRFVWKIESELKSDHLEQLYAYLSAIDLRQQWCSWLKEQKCIHKTDSNIRLMSAKLSEDENINWIEKLTCVDQVRYVASWVHSYYFAIQINARQSHTTATIYLQWDSVALDASRVSSMLSSLFEHLTKPPITAWIRQCDKSIEIHHESYTEDAYTVDYTYQAHSHPAALEIHPKINQQRWHSGSWDQQTSYNQTLRKNNFMSSSFLFNSASSSPQLHPIRSSYPENRQMFPWPNDEETEEIDRLDTDELCIQTTEKPDMSVLLADKPAWSDKFIQQCVQCVFQPSRHHSGSYLIKIVHPHAWMQSLTENLEEMMKLDEEEDKIPSHIKLVIRNSKDHRCLVNGHDWPIRSRVLSSSEEEEESRGSDQGDIFVDGMEEISSPKLTDIPNMSHMLMKPSSSAPVPTLQTAADKEAFDVYQKKPASIHEPTIPISSNINSKHPQLRRHSGSSIHPFTPQDLNQLAESEPIALRKIYPQFIDYLQTTSASIVQTPTKENGYVTIKHFPVPNHPMGGFLAESIWEDCSVWDVKAVLENGGARRVWDSTFENTIFLHALTPNSAIWHTKLKGAWPVQPRDEICFHGQYTSSDANRIDLVSTSCFGDSFQYKPLPPKSPGYTRATIDLAGYRLEQTENTVFVRHVMLTQFPTWVIQYFTSRALIQTCSAIQCAHDYLRHHGAPPSLVKLEWASLGDVTHDHDRNSWRCEYTRRINKDDPEMAQKLTHATVSLIRLDKRKWAKSQHYSVVIDPPPSHTIAFEKHHDPTGVWLSIEHDEAFIIPFRGKILVLIKYETSTNKEDGLQVNGVLIPIERKKQESRLVIHPKEPKPLIPPISDPILPEPVKKVWEDASIKQQAQAALSFLKQTEEQFGWSVVSENHRSGIRVSKKSGIKDNRPTKELVETHQRPSWQVFEPYMIYKGSKVMENFSVEEILAVITDTGHVRACWDDTIEFPIEVVHQTDEPACKIVHYAIKAVFPFKSRDVHAVSCLANDHGPTKRMMYVESTLSESPTLGHKRPTTNFYLSGWIVEEIDPYSTTNTNHPIPSTRVTHVGSLDLGNSVPSYMSNLVANNWFPRKINAVESFLKSKGAPPFLIQPDFALTSIEVVKTTQWSQVQIVYDEHHRFQFTAHLELTESVIKKKPSKDKDLKSLYWQSSKTHLDTPSRPRRRGSLPSTAFPKHRLNLTPSSSSQTVPSIEKPATLTTRGLVLLQTAFDLRAYETGYEVDAQLFDITDAAHQKNLTHQLRLSVSEPSLAQLMDGNKRRVKHTLIVQTQQGKSLSTSLPASFKFCFKLIPIRQETLQQRAKQLTVSQVLEADVDQSEWHGLIIVNGTEILPNSEISLQPFDTTELTFVGASDESKSAIDKVSVTDSPASLEGHIEAIRSTIDPVSQSEDPYGSTSKTQMAPKKQESTKSGGVMATALENVSAGVNTLGAHMLYPFRTTSGSFLPLNESESNNRPHSSIKEEEFTDETEQNISQNHRIATNDQFKTDAIPYYESLSKITKRHAYKYLSLLIVCLSISILVALLVLHFVFTKFHLATLDDFNDEQRMICQLLHTSWFGGWDLQLVATRRPI
ncbi:hypothetical protein BD560DRAFT_491184 [Blakeslea trispora]|nr:hypothetical protein BD560DRAFT_491184 [Blakeslea trispora]